MGIITGNVGDKDNKMKSFTEMNNLRRKKRKRGKCKRCGVITTHTEFIIYDGYIDYRLEFFCKKCTKETPID